MEATDLLIFALGKLAAFMLGVAARFPGDTLEPVLIAGGFMGGFVGKILPASMLGPEANAACEIFGMVGLFASCFRFPLTPVVIVPGPPVGCQNHGMMSEQCPKPDAPSLKPKARVDGDAHLQHHPAGGPVLLHCLGSLKPSLPSHPGADPTPGQVQSSKITWQLFKTYLVGLGGWVSGDCKRVSRGC